MVTIEREGRDLAARVVLKYFQTWGQPQEERDEAIRKAATWAGVDENDEGFRGAIETCWPLGQFEQEAAAIFSVMQQFRKLHKEA